MTAEAVYSPFSPLTAATWPSSTEIPSARSRTSLTCRRLSSRSSAAVMSNDRSDTGNTRLPRSTLSGTPSPSKKSMASCPSKRENTEYKNRGFCGTWASSSSQVLSFVTLQRPLPVMFTFLPRRSFGSSSVTCAPLRAAHHAARAAADDNDRLIHLRSCRKCRSAPRCARVRRTSRRCLRPSCWPRPE